MSTPKPDPKPSGWRGNGSPDQTAPGGKHQAVGNTLGNPNQGQGKHQKGGGK